MREPRIKGGRTWHGAKWCRRSTRLAIYHRDGHACVYCGATERLSLDHVTPEELGGTHAPTNLVTCCFSCNSARQHRTMRTWLAYLRTKGIDTTGIARRVRRATGRPLDRAEGRRLAAGRMAA
jgi:hypothetical protein